MLDVLQPIVKQLDETYEALHCSLRLLNDDQLGWTPGPAAQTVAQVVQHIARANVRYAAYIGPEDRPWDRELKPVLPRDELLSRVDKSQRIAVETLEALTAENLYEPRADSWSPNCPEQEIAGPLDALWFALRSSRRSFRPSRKRMARARVFVCWPPPGRPPSASGALLGKRHLRCTRSLPSAGGSTT